MRNDILDQIEKNTGPRTCPQCGYQFPLWPLVKRLVMSYGSTKWHCPNCGESLKCDTIKLQMIWLVSLLLYSVPLGVLIYYFDLGLLNIAYMIPYFVYVLFTFNQVNFKKSEPKA